MKEAEAEEVRKTEADSLERRAAIKRAGMDRELTVMAHLMYPDTSLEDLRYRADFSKTHALILSELDKVVGGRSQYGVQYAVALEEHDALHSGGDGKRRRVSKY
jgi:hypothetical protein